MNRLFILIVIVCGWATQSARAQLTGDAFVNYQLTFPRVSAAYNTYNASLQAALINKKIGLDFEAMLIRSFKSQNEMEVWIQDKGADTFRLFKKYNVCALSGNLGPKRKEGDLQVPEGYYFITEFNPTSDFHLSLYVNYPNYSDKLLGHQKTPGGDIYIHGGCVTVGCLPLTDAYVRELYVLCLMARRNGQLNIPVQIFPTRFGSNTIDFLTKKYNKDSDENMHRFWLNLKSGYDYFEKYHKLIPVMYDESGRYVY